MFIDSPSVSQRGTPSIPKWRISSTSTESTMSSKTSKLTSLELDKRSAIAPTLSPEKVTHRRSFDAETASFYSSMSAPLDYHERLFCAPLMALDPYTPVSAPARIRNAPSMNGYPTLSPAAPKSRGSSRYPQHPSNHRTKATRCVSRRLRFVDACPHFL
jgi:hypothetical protein